MNLDLVFKLGLKDIQFHLPEISIKILEEDLIYIPMARQE